MPRGPLGVAQARAGADAAAAARAVVVRNVRRDRLVGHQPQAMLLTHYSRVTEIERLAGELRHQIGELATLARAADGRPDRAARLRQGVRELVHGWVHDHGTPLPAPAVDALLDVDIELNAQGLEAWLDRDRR